MTKKEFIEKWNVAFEDKEQKEEFASEMSEDLDLVIQCSQSTQWIKVEERLPDNENNVFAFLDGQVCCMAYFTFKEDGEDQKVWGYVYDGLNGDAIYDDNYQPTHWAEITPPID